MSAPEVYQGYEIRAISFRKHNLHKWIITKLPNRDGILMDSYTWKGDRIQSLKHAHRDCRENIDGLLEMKHNRENPPPKEEHKEYPYATAEQIADLRR